MSSIKLLAIDLGASSGRVIRAIYDGTPSIIRGSSVQKRTGES